MPAGTKWRRLLRVNDHINHGGTTRDQGHFKRLLKLVFPMNANAKRPHGLGNLGELHRREPLTGRRLSKQGESLLDHAIPTVIEHHPNHMGWRPPT